ncbi:hypothetical protein N9A80_02595 [Rhodopirellula sp.]|nr:hypothetical protein [Rhodopirellula sp.]
MELTERTETATTQGGVDASTAIKSLNDLEQLVSEKTSEYEALISDAESSIEFNEFNKKALKSKLQEQLATTAARNNALVQQSLKLGSEIENAAQHRQALAAEYAALQDEQEKLDKTVAACEKLSRATDEIENSEAKIFRDQVNNGKSLCLVELKQHTIIIHDAATKNVESFPDSQGFIAWEKSVNPSRRHYVLFVNPKGVMRFPEVRQHFDTISCSYGFDLVKSGFEAKLSFELETVE